MDAKKCDRCGELYEYQAGVDFMVNTLLETGSTLVITKEARIDAYSHKVDLCPSCMKSLIDWMNRGYA